MAEPLPARGSRVRYRVSAGYFYEGTVVDHRPDGTLDISVMAKPLPVKLTARPWWPGDPQECPLRACTHPLKETQP